MSVPTTDLKEAHGAFSNPTEQPPSYEPAQSSSAAALRPEDALITALPLCFPPVDASASDVRTYIRSFLWHNATKYDLSQEDVVRVASAWRYGSGGELRSYERPTWESLFGVEMGSVLLKQVQEEIVAEKKVEADKSYGLHIVWIVLSAVLTLFGIGLCSAADEDDLGVASVMATIFLFVPASVLFFGSLADLYMKRQRRRGVAAQTKGDYIRLNGSEDTIPSSHVDAV